MISQLVVTALQLAILFSEPAPPSTRVSHAQDGVIIESERANFSQRLSSGTGVVGASPASAKASSVPVAFLPSLMTGGIAYGVDGGCLINSLDPFTGCTDPDPDNPEAASGPGNVGLTVAMVERAVVELPFPTSAVVVQPAGRTLVNLDTILHTDTGAYSAAFTLLGANVSVAGVPERWVWHHGDGTSQHTGHAGDPYPFPSITHQYLEPGESLSLSVEVHYRVTYRVNGGTPFTLAQPVITTGPVTTIDVLEAIPTLITNPNT